MPRIVPARGPAPGSAPAATIAPRIAPAPGPAGAPTGLAMVPLVDVVQNLNETPAPWLPPAGPGDHLTVVHAPAGRAASDAAAPRAPAPFVSLGVGSVVAERFRLDALLGTGGMAAVFRATDLDLGEEIALKLLQVEGSDPQAVARFKQEVSLARRLTHPNVVRIHDIGEHEGRRFITMELVVGTSMGALLDGRPMELGRALGYLVQACAGLGAAHAHGIVHRDVKPDNFLVTDAGVVKVMDFGIAKARAASGLTAAGFVAGTPSYISPEQISGFTSVTHLSDVYSLGITAYELLTGTVPFAHAELMPLLLMHLQTAPEPPRLRNPALPPELDTLVLRLLEKTPAARVQSCDELAQAFEAIRRAHAAG